MEIPGDGVIQPAEGSAFWRRAVKVCSLCALVWTVAARMTGPSDAWDQAQPTTMAYTIDILVNGNWILPEGPIGIKATKPPLFNWLAAPAVRLWGFSSEWAHKLPSVVALCACWLVLVGVGTRLDPTRHGTTGWLAAMFLVANYSYFKLGYLARPDMVATLWLILGAVAVTALLVADDRLSANRARLLALAFWVCTGLAALTKGPAALVLPIYALLAARLVAGRWGAARAVGWWWGAPLAMAMFGVWVLGVWRVDAAHLLDEMWGNEIVGRVTGRGPVGTSRGPVALFTTVSYMPLYYLGFFAPWSVLSVLAAIWLWGRERPGAWRRWRGMGARGAALAGASAFVAVTIIFYSLSAGKRADYAVAAYAPGALLAAWWLVARPGRLGTNTPWPALAAAVITLGGLTYHGRGEFSSPQKGFGDAIGRFIKEAETHVAADPAPMIFWVVDCSHLQSYLGSTNRDDAASVMERVEAGHPFWLFSGAPPNPGRIVKQTLRDTRVGGTMTEACRSEWLTWNQHWPGRVILYRVDPGRPIDADIDKERPDRDP